MERRPASSQGTTVTLSPTPSSSRQSDRAGPSQRRDLSQSPSVSHNSSSSSEWSSASLSSSSDDDLPDAPSPTSRRSDSPDDPNPGQKISRRSILRDRKSYKSVIWEIQEDEATDLRARLAERARFEALAAEYWTFCYEEEQSARRERRLRRRKRKMTAAAVQEEGDDEIEEVAENVEEQEEMQERHDDHTRDRQQQESQRNKAKICRQACKCPMARYRLKMFRWPVRLDDCDRPTWTPGDEIVALTERILHWRKAEPLDYSIIVPTVAIVMDQMTAALGRLTSGQCYGQQDTLRDTSSKDHLADWTDVLRYIDQEADLSSIPDLVANRVRKRLLAIYGPAHGEVGANRLEKVTDAFTSASAEKEKDLGIVNRLIRDAARDPLPPQPDPIFRQGFTSSAAMALVNKKKRRKPSDVKETDALLLLEPRYNNRARYLELPPVASKRRR